MENQKRGAGIPRIGVYTMGLETYWTQFPGLKERLIGYGRFIAARVRDMGAECVFFGIVDSPLEGRRCAAWMNERKVDLVFAHAGTYATSASVLPVHQNCVAPVVVLNLQPTAQLNYAETTTGEWLANCGACPVPEISNAFERCGIPFRVVNGLLGLPESTPGGLADEKTSQRPEAQCAWKQIEEWVRAVEVQRTLRETRFGFLGDYYCGMLDMYSDFTMFQAQTGAHVEVLEMCDLNRRLDAVTPEEQNRKYEEIISFFKIADGGADPRNRRPSREQLEWSARVACAQDRLVADFGLGALCYYYHGEPGGAYEILQSGSIVGYSLLTAEGVPCAGEGDLKTCLAMKVCDILGVGGSFCEIVCTDYEQGTILMGHDGPFHLKIASQQPVLRGLGVYHGKQGEGISVEAKVKAGPVTTLGCTQLSAGKLRFLATQAHSTKGPIMAIGNTQTHVRFSEEPDRYMDRWFAQAPTHHFAMSVGHNAAQFKKAAELLGIDFVDLGGSL